MVQKAGYYSKEHSGQTLGRTATLETMKYWDRLFGKWTEPPLLEALKKLLNKCLPEMMLFVVLQSVLLYTGWMHLGKFKRCLTASVKTLIVAVLLSRYTESILLFTA